MYDSVRVNETDDITVFGTELSGFIAGFRVNVCVYVRAKTLIV